MNSWNSCVVGGRPGQVVVVLGMVVAGTEVVVVRTLVLGMVVAGTEVVVRTLVLGMVVAGTVASHPSLQISNELSITQVA